MKKEFRKFCLENLKANRYLFSKKIGKILYETAKKHEKILFFLPLKIEPDVFWVIKKLKREGKSVFVPLVEDDSFKMVKYSLPLKKNKFSILEPHNKRRSLEKIDLAIVPVVGIDADFKRVGFGKGMYDRFFANLNYRPKIVFVQLRPCISNRGFNDPFDVQADEYISFNVRRKNDDIGGYSNFFFIASRGIFHSQKT